jgi:F-type H+-transporting ATPase subunit epsilon
LVRRGNQEDSMAISGGFLEVRPDRVIVLADSAERAEEIDVARAEAAKKRAEERLRDRKVEGLDETRAEASLRRAIARLSVAEKMKRRRKV